MVGGEGVHAGRYEAVAGKARQAEAKLRRIVSTYGVPPAAARDLQLTIIQGAMLYVAELTWDGKVGVEGEY